MTSRLDSSSHLYTVTIAGPLLGVSVSPTRATMHCGVRAIIDRPVGVANVACTL